METIANSGLAAESAPLAAQLHRATTTLPAKILGAATVAAILIGMVATGGLAVAAVVTILIVSAPLLLFLSPILVPIGTVVAVATAAFLASSSAALAALVAVQWVYNYRKGRKPVGSQPVEAAQKAVGESFGAIKSKMGVNTQQNYRDKDTRNNGGAASPVFPSPRSAAAATASGRSPRGEKGGVASPRNGSPRSPHTAAPPARRVPVDGPR